MNTHMLTFSAIFLLMIAGLNPVTTSKDNLPTDPMDAFRKNHCHQCQ